MVSGGPFSYDQYTCVLLATVLAASLAGKWAGSRVISEQVPLKQQH